MSQPQQQNRATGQTAHDSDAKQAQYEQQPWTTIQKSTAATPVTNKQQHKSQTPIGISNLFSPLATSDKQAAAPATITPTTSIATLTTPTMVAPTPAIITTRAGDSGTSETKAQDMVEDTDADTDDIPSRAFEKIAETNKRRATITPATKQDNGTDRT